MSPKIGVVTLAVLLTMPMSAGWCVALDRAPLDRILAVLRLRPSEASRSCLGAMADVHQTERLLNKPPGVAHDASLDLEMTQRLLQSEYENGAQICGADAERVCRNPDGADLAPACAAIHAVAGQ